MRAKMQSNLITKEMIANDTLLSQLFFCTLEYDPGGA